MIEQTILDKLPAPVLTFDLESARIAYINSEMETALGISRNKLLNLPVQVLDSLLICSDHTPFSQSLSAVTGLRHSFPARIKFPDKNHYLFKYQVSIQDESVLGVCLFQESALTPELHHIENELTFSPENLRNIRSMFNSLVGLSQLIMLEEDRTKLPDLHSELQAVISTILLTFEREQTVILPEEKVPLSEPATSSKVFDLAKSLKKEISSLLSLIRQKQLHLRFSSYEDSVVIDGNEREIIGLIRDFLLMAITLSEKGEIRCEIFYRTQGNEKQVCIKIVDCGPGLRKSVLEHIEQPGKFNLLEVDALSGELLALIHHGKKITGYYGGELFFESHYGIGNSTSLILPINTRTEIKLKPLPTGTELHTPPSLLIVDDDSIVHQIIKRYLANRCKIESAMDGRRALTLLSKTHFDIMFLDINLGVGLTGLQVAKQIRRMPEYEKTPIVAITAYAMPGDKERAYAAGCDFYQSKPFSKDDIINLFEKCFARIVPHNNETQN